jgi:hypothetical protein
LNPEGPLVFGTWPRNPPPLTKKALGLAAEGFLIFRRDRLEHDAATVAEVVVPDDAALH